jgi:Ca2+-transporting ATPase
LSAIVYLPFMHTVFGTFSLPPVDWLIIIGLAVTVVPVLELGKWMERRGWFGKFM